MDNICQKTTTHQQQVVLPNAFYPSAQEITDNLRHPKELEHLSSHIISVSTLFSQARCILILSLLTEKSL